MSPPSHTSTPCSSATFRSLYLALFRVTAIADLEGPDRAVEWAQSMLDDEQLRAAFVARVADERAPARRESFERRPADRGIPVIRLGEPEPRRFVRA